MSAAKIGLLAVTGLLLCACASPVAQASLGAPASEMPTSGVSTAASSAPSATLSSASPAKPVITTIGPIGWDPATYDPSQPPPIPGTVADPSLRWCTAKDLHTGWPPSTPDPGGGLFQGATGNWVGPLLVTNASASPCALQGTPRLRIVDATGRLLTASAMPAASARFVLDPWLRLAPGQSADTSVWWMWEFCGTATAPYRVLADLPHDGGQVAEVIGDGRPRCDEPGDARTADEYGSIGPIDPFDRWTLEPDPSTPPTVEGAEVSFGANAPAGGFHAHPGQTLDYTLLAFGVPAGYGASPCLPYREFLTSADDGDQIGAAQMHVLNCKAVPAQLPAHAIVAFDMKVTIPAAARPGAELIVNWESALGQLAAIPDPITVD